MSLWNRKMMGGREGWDSNGVFAACVVVMLETVVVVVV